MTPLPHNPGGVDPRRIVAARARRKRPRRKLRIEWLLVPALTMLAAWVLNQVQPAFVWSELMAAVRVHETRAYTRLAVLGLLLVGACAIVRIWRGKDGR